MPEQDGDGAVAPAPSMALEPWVSQAGLVEVRAGLDLMAQVVADILEPEVDYGLIPGTQTPSLWEPGADTVANAFNSYAQPIILREEVSPADQRITYVVRADLLSRITGQVVASGIGTASTLEGKYGKRWVRERDVRDLGLDPSALRTRQSRDRDGETVTLYRAPNMEWSDLVHTLLQMAFKRAKVDAAQQLPGVSSTLRRLFTGGERVPLENWRAFWSELRTWGITLQDAHQLLGVASIRQEWIGRGKTLADARALLWTRTGGRASSTGAGAKAAPAAPAAKPTRPPAAQSTPPGRPNVQEVADFFAAAQEVYGLSRLQALTQLGLDDERQLGDAAKAWASLARIMEREA